MRSTTSPSREWCIPEHGPGFDLWVGGGLSTNPMLGQRLGAWVPLDEIPDVWAGVISIFRDYGYRRLRNRARLKFLVADWGVQKFREVLEQQYLKRTLIDGPAPELPTGPRDHVGVHPQKDGKFYVGINPTVGRVSGSTLTKFGRYRGSPWLRSDSHHHRPGPGDPRHRVRSGRFLGRARWTSSAFRSSRRPSDGT